jgi:hypothetical protein
MTISGTVAVNCPGCGRAHEATLVQSLNTRLNPELKARLLAGELNLLACDCGKRTLLSATLLYHDPDRDYFCQVCPGGEDAMKRGELAFDAIGAVGTRRLVPSQNALVEKVKILDAGMDDRVVEMLKVLMLASTGRDQNSVLLFDRRDGDAVVWVLLDQNQMMRSPYPAYEKLAATLKPAEDLRIDRVWATEAVRTLIATGN